MLNNDVLRSLRFMLNISETQISAWLHEVHCEVSSEQLKSYLSKEDEADFISCPDRVLGHFLDALIIQKRGRNEQQPLRPLELPVTNNQILKKLRVAFELKEQDIQDILMVADFPMTKSELGALFRRPDQQNYRPCGDQLLRNFLKGLTLRLKPKLKAN